jgi:hypothetical protein
MYMHTLTCLLVMLLLKPTLVVVPLQIIQAFLEYIGRTKCGTWLLGCSFLRPVKALSHGAAQLKQRSSRVVVKLAKQGSRHISRAARHLAKRRGAKQGHHETPSAITRGATIVDEDGAATILQTVWRHRNPRVRAAHRNIAILKRNVLSYLDTAKVCRMTHSNSSDPYSVAFLFVFCLPHCCSI